MASILRRRGSHIWTAFFRDVNGRLHCRSTGTTERNAAKVIAAQYEEASRKARTLRQIQRVLGDMHRLTGGADELSRLTVAEHIKAWLKAKQNEVAESSMKFFRGSSQRFSDYLGAKADRCLFEITKADIVAYRDHLAAQVGARTTDHLMGTVKAIFRSAVADDLIADDPAEHVKPIRKEKNADKRRSFTVHEIQAMLEVADSEWRSMILFGLYTGQRLSDLANLTWANIDLARDEIRLETGNTGRVMTIPMASRLRQHIEGLPVSDDPAAFIHPRCAEKTQPALSAEFSRLLVSAGLRRNDTPSARSFGSRRRTMGELSFHSLRHTAVSMLHEAGLPMATVLEYVGHSSASMSKKYTHVGIEALRKAADSLPKI